MNQVVSRAKAKDVKPDGTQETCITYSLSAFLCVFFVLGGKAGTASTDVPWPGVRSSRSSKVSCPFPILNSLDDPDRWFVVVL